MTEDKSWLTSSPEETERVGEDLAQKLRGGELILLVLSLIHISEPTRPY